MGDAGSTRTYPPSSDLVELVVVRGTPETGDEIKLRCMICDELLDEPSPGYLNHAIAAWYRHVEKKVAEARGRLPEPGQPGDPHTTRVI